MVAFSVERIDVVTLSDGSPLAGMDLMSPFVWREGAEYRLLVRGVPCPLRRADATGLIAAGRSANGLRFEMEPQLAIAPGADEADADAGGCEDPTVVMTDREKYLVFYTGVDWPREQGALLLATGPTLTDLTKRRVMLKAPPGRGNIKEATLARSADGSWRLFYEYAQDKASRIGVATGPSAEGPWTVIEDPFTIRDDSWDNWHLSTGPIFTPPGGGEPVMFYNGATPDARWRIGWISFARDYSQVTGRGIEPMILPPPPRDRSATDIAFAASTVIEDERIALYYSLEDRILRRAMIRYYS